MKILIVEDEIIPANYLKKVLENEGYNVTGIIKRGDEAIRFAREYEPDIIFMDIMLQDSISGADAAVEIHFTNPNIGIIFLTAFSDQEMIEFAVRSEAFAYLLKPYREEEILATLKLAEVKLKLNDVPNVEIQQPLILIKLVEGYVYNRELERLFLNDKEIELGPKAMQLIKLLCENRNITLEIDEIIAQLWDEVKPKQTLRSLIHRIRQITTPELIQNVNKFGYRIGVES